MSVLTAFYNWTSRDVAYCIQDRVITEQEFVTMRVSWEDMHVMTGGHTRTWNPNEIIQAVFESGQTYVYQMDTRTWTRE